jgi:predicted Zn-dependent protease
LQTGSSDKVANVLGMAMLRLNAKDPPPPGSTDAAVILGVGRAECLAGQKKYDEAKPAFEGIVNQNPTFLNVHYAFGLFLTELRDIPGAVEQFKEEIKNHPDHLFARLRIAAVDYKVNSGEAIPFAREAVTLDPQQPFTHYLMGLLLLDVDDYANAIPELETAQKGLPREPKIYFALGTAYSRAGRRNEAAKARATFARLTEEEKSAGAGGGQPEPRSSGPEQIPVGDIPSAPH